MCQSRDPLMSKFQVSDHADSFVIYLDRSIVFLLSFKTHARQVKIKSYQFITPRKISRKELIIGSIRTVKHVSGYGKL